MNTKFKRIMTTIILIVMLFNYAPTVSYAETTTSDDDSAWNVLGEGVLAGLDGLVGVFTILPRVVVVLVSAAIQGIASLLGHSDGSTNADIMITVEDIFFNKLNITKIDFFDMSNANSTKGVVKTFRENVAIWYYALRSLAIIILLCILIYVGIRMAISTVASEKAMYKTMLKDWIVSFILVFFMHYIIIVTIQVNTALVNILSGALSSKGSAEFMSKLAMMGIGVNIDDIEISAIKSWASAIVYAMMAFFTLGFLWTYIKRMITLAFLIIISPLVTITYSIDKMGDGKSQALNTWLKEFVYNVLLQPFQCVIYLALMKTSIEMLNNSNPSLGIAFLTILCMYFTYEAEKIVRKIFGFDKASSIADSMATTAALITGMNTLGKIGGKGKTPAAVKNAGNKAASTTNAGLAANKIANKNVNRALQAAKETIREGVNKMPAPIKNAAATVSTPFRAVSSGASKVSDAVKNVKDAAVQSLHDIADNGTPIKKMAANATLAAGEKVKDMGDSVKKDIKGAVSGIGHFTRSIATGPGAIQAGMAVVGMSAGLASGNATNAVTYGIAGSEIGAKMSAPAQEKYRERQEKKLSDNYKAMASDFEKLDGGIGNYDLSTEAGRENMKEKAKELTEKGSVKVNSEFDQNRQNYSQAIENRIRASNPSLTEREIKRQANSEVKQTYNEILNGNIDNIIGEIDDLNIHGDTNTADLLQKFAISAKEKELSDNLNRMMGIEAALGDGESEKTVVTGKNSTIDRINAGIAQENA